MMDEAKLTEILDEFTKLQKAILVRLEAKIENNEQIVGTLVATIVEMSALLTALVEERLKQPDSESFKAEVVRHKTGAVEALKTGAIYAQDSYSQISSST